MAEKRPVTVRLDSETKRKFDIALADQQTTAQQVLTDLIDKWIEQHSRQQKAVAGE